MSEVGLWEFAIKILEFDIILKVDIVAAVNFDTTKCFI